MTGTTATCGHNVTAVGAPNSPARLKTESVPCAACQDADNARRSVPKWKPCPACGFVYDATKLHPPLVPLTVSCACCCR
jgi:hypothetical protein